jgi:hypothetical protein
MYNCGKVWFLLTLYYTATFYFIHHKLLTLIHHFKFVVKVEDTTHMILIRIMEIKLIFAVRSIF